MNINNNYLNLPNLILTIMKSKTKKKANDLTSNFKASTLGASLVHSGMSLNQIEILPLGGRKRAYSKEIENIYTLVSETSGLEYTRIEINREGIYDMLPEGLFHTLATGTEVLDEDIMIEDIRIKRQEEKEARTFFAPFEIELSYARILLEVYENRLDMQTSFNEMSNLLVRSWEELKKLNSKQRVIWMHFIPEIQYHKNDLNYLQEFLTLLTNLPITIKKKTITKQNNWVTDDLEANFALGKTTLGLNSITKQSELETVDTIEIKIGPSTPDLIQSYLPNEKNESIITMTTDYLLPTNIDIEIIYDLLPEIKFSQLTDVPQSSTTVLGHTSYL